MLRIACAPATDRSAPLWTPTFPETLKPCVVSVWGIITQLDEWHLRVHRIWANEWPDDSIYGLSIGVNLLHNTRQKKVMDEQFKSHT